MAPSVLSAGTMVGRFVVGELVGAGGMGVVYRASDRELKRSVALKLLRGKGGAAEEQQERLLREAQAIAQVSHPNVVQVFDVGLYREHVFVAMEFVDGETAREWVARKRPSRREILGVFVQAARGLAAAHEAGIVHRDFKPDNVLLGRDGRVRVADFGLARLVDEAEGLPSGASDDLDFIEREALTQSGTLLGTPAYMAPEQHRGQECDHRSDQFAFCVSFYELLCGERPFAGDTLAELAESTEAGRRWVSAAERHLSKWVRRLLARGLQPDPSQRFSSMVDLIAELERDRGRRRRTATALVGGAAIAAGVFALGLGSRGGVDRCESGRARIAEIWTPGRRASIAAAFSSAPLPYAQSTWARVEPALERWTRQWAATHRDACRATHVSGEQSDRMLDLRMACLSRQRAALDALLSALDAPDDTTIAQASRAVSSLPPVSACSNLEALQKTALPPGDATSRRRLAAVEETLAAAEAQLRTGHYREGVADLESILAQARQLAHKPLEARVYHRLGTGQLRAGRLEEAEASFYSAIRAADAAGDDRVRAEARIALVKLIGRDRARAEEGARLVELAEGTLARLSQPAPYRARLDETVGAMLAQQGELDEAEKRFLSALELTRKHAGSEHPGIASILSSLGNLQLFRGDYARALDFFERGLAIVESAHGPAHPVTGAHVDNIGIAHWYLGDYARAIVQHRRAVATLESALGKHHPKLGGPLTNLANALQMSGQLREAARIYRRALGIAREAFGVDHPTVSTIHLNLGSVRAELEEADRALEHFEKAMEIQKRVLGEKHADVGLSLTSIALVLSDLEKHRDAIEHFDRALAILEPALGPAHPDLVEALVGKGVAQVKISRARAAIQSLERAVEIARKHEVAPEKLARSLFALARAIALDAAQHRRARRLAGEALELFESATDSEDESAEVQKWLDARD